MAIKRPDIYEHNNVNLAISDTDFHRGGFRTPVATVNDLYALSGKTGFPSAPGQLKEYSTIVYVSGETKYYVLKDINNVGNSNGWEVFNTGSGSTTGGTTVSVNNGLTIEGENIVLGGALTGATTINGSGQTFNVSNLDSFQISTLNVSGTSTNFGIDGEGLLYSFSGGSLTYDDGGGLKYGADYSSGYTAYSVPDVNYVTGLTSVYMKLDQTTPQTISNGQPVFDDGITLSPNPEASLISGHTKGRMFYDDAYQTISVNIGNDATLQLGQEAIRYVYNATGSIIPNGSLVYTNGVHTSGGVDTVTVDLAIATGITESAVIGIATESIPVNGYGFITTTGNINGLDTVNGQYTSISVGDVLYLSATVAGGVTNVAPTTPNINVFLGRLLTKDASDGKLFINIDLGVTLDSIIDVSAPSPSLDDVLKYNGIEWVNAQSGAVSASAGVNYYYSTPITNTVTSPAGISSDGTVGNGIMVATLSNVPVTSGGTQLVVAAAGSETRAFAAWERSGKINRTSIDAGVWDFYDYINVESAVAVTNIIHQIYRIVEVTGTTVTTTGAGNTYTATTTGNQFSGMYFTASTVNTDASYIQTPSGIYQISAFIDDNNVEITVPTTYAAETGVLFKTWNKLFDATSIEVDALTTTLYTTSVTAPAFTILNTDKLGQISFVSSTGDRQLTLSYNGTISASYFTSPLITLHNDLSGLQGGTGTERVHLTFAELTNLNNQSNINTGDETKSTIESKLTGEIITHTHPYSGISGTPDLTKYQSVSGFTGYTASTNNIILSAFTGATNYGSGATVYSGTSDHNLYFNTIKGSGGTTVQKVGDEIIINSITSQGSQLYSGQTPSALDLGGISVGYELTGKTISCIIQDLLVPELFGTITAPSISISLTHSGIREIGCNISQTVQGTFNQGNINPQYESISNKRSGLPISYTFTGVGMPVPPQACTSLTASEINASYTVVSGTQSWSVSTTYEGGSPALGSKGTEYCAALPSGTTSPATSSITGILPWYWGTSSSMTITGTDVANGTKTVANVGASTPIVFNASNEYLWFAAPTGAYTTKTKWWVCAANAGNIGNAGDLWAAACTVNVSSAQGCWANCSFDVYVTCGVTSTDSGVSMCLYY